MDVIGKGLVKEVARLRRGIEYWPTRTTRAIVQDERLLKAIVTHSFVWPAGPRK